MRHDPLFVLIYAIVFLVFLLILLRIAAVY